jgi:membrane protease YdiL (CAAX protease family)
MKIGILSFFVTIFKLVLFTPILLTEPANLTFNNLDMEKKIVKYIVIIVNIMCFVVIHYIDYGSCFVSILMSLLPKLAMSTSLVFVYLKTRDIKYNIILHMLYNFFIIFVSYINY